MQHVVNVVMGARIMFPVCLCWCPATNEHVTTKLQCLIIYRIPELGHVSAS